MTAAAPPAPPKLPPKASAILRRFLVAANHSLLHQLDWNRFYTFIWHCASYNVSCSEESLVSLLVADGFREPVARDIANVYYHGRRIATRRIGG